jgi:hypothetical protein
MKKRGFIVGVLIIMTLLVSSCLSEGWLPSEEWPPFRPGPIPLPPTQIPTTSLADAVETITNLITDEERQATFQGDVIATARFGFQTQRWVAAGWAILHEVIDTSQGIPADCVMRQMSGVTDQWIGRCKGWVFIPVEGAENINVILTRLDGSETHFQIAPPPTGP